MQMDIADTADGLVHVTLAGRLDTQGVQRIEAPPDAESAAATART